MATKRTARRTRTRATKRTTRRTARRAPARRASAARRTTARRTTRARATTRRKANENLRFRSSIYATNASDGRRISEDFFMARIAQDMKKFDNLDRAILIAARGSSRGFENVMRIIEHLKHMGSAELDVFAASIYRLIRRDVRTHPRMERFLQTRNWSKATELLEVEMNNSKKVFSELEKLRQKAVDLLRRRYYYSTEDFTRSGLRVDLSPVDEGRLNQLTDMVDEVLDSEQRVLILDTEMLRRFHENYYNDLVDAKNALIERRENVRRTLKEVLPTVASERRESVRDEARNELQAVERELRDIDVEIKQLR